MIVSRIPNVAVVGCGYWGPNLIRNLAALRDCNMVQVCDADTERLAHMKNLYPDVRTSTNFDDVLNNHDVDAVVIATPISTHYTLAKKVLLADKHVFVEKPLATSSADGKDLIEIAQQRRLILMVGHTFVYTPAVRYLKKMVQNGELGEVYYISSRRLNLGLFQKDINVAWDLAPHDLSIVLYILNDQPIAVNCQGKGHVVPGLEDVTNMSLDFPNGTLATIHSSWLDPNKVREMTIVGSEKMVVYDDLAANEKIRVYDKRVETPPHYDTFAEFQYSYHYGEVNTPFIRQVEPLKVECEHFIDCIRTGKNPDSGGLEGLRVVQILEASSESLKRGGSRVDIPVE